jgi:hypothetical protein
MNEEYKKKLEKRGFKGLKFDLVREFTTADDKLVTVLTLDKSVFAELDKTAGVNGMVDVIQRRVCDEYDVLSEQFKVLQYHGDGRMLSIIAVLAVDKEVGSKFLMKREEWVN